MMKGGYRLWMGEYVTTSNRRVEIIFTFSSYFSSVLHRIAIDNRSEATWKFSLHGCLQCPYEDVN